jgi:hypothetical protein
LGDDEVKNLADMTYRTIIGAIIDINKGTYFNDKNALNESEYIKWLVNMREASRVCHELCIAKLREFEVD